MTPTTDPDWRGVAKRAPFSFLAASALGLGLLPVGPGTWGSLLGAGLYWSASGKSVGVFVHFTGLALSANFVLCFLLAGLGVWTSARIARATAAKDPQFVVIDEVSGQLLTYVLAPAPANWKYLLAGFILFRVFDIWKPFPIRKAEQWPGGWGIMADDWIAGIYAALVLWVARALGL